MTSRSQDHARLAEKIYHASNSGSITRLLGRLKPLEDEGRLKAEESYELRLVALRSLKEITADDAEKAGTLIIRYILPVCAEETEGTPTRAAVYRHRLREALVEWLDQYQRMPRQRLLNSVLNWLAEQLKVKDPQNACWTIAAIGFRRDDIVEALWQLVAQSSEEIGNTALSVLVTLGVPQAQRQTLVSSVHERIVKRPSAELLWILQKIADPSSVELINRVFLHETQVGGNPELASIALGALATIADTSSQDAELQDRIWRHIAGSIDAFPLQLRHVVYLGDVAPRCDSPQVIVDLLRWLRLESGPSDEASHRRFLLGLRMAECVRPRQIEGWEFTTDDKFLGLLKRDAISDTGRDVRATTQESLWKETAWETGLRLGRTQVLGWAARAVVHETSSFVSHTLALKLASFRLQPLSQDIVRLVTDEFDEPADNSSTEWARRIGAIELAAAAASKKALKALLDCGFTFHGEVLLSTTEALADVALAVAAEGYPSAVRAVLATALGSGTGPRQLNAAAALPVLASHGFLSKRQLKALEDAIFDDSRTPLVRSALIDALSKAPESEISERTLRRFESLVGETEDRQALRALELIIRKSRLDMLMGILVGRLGLRRSEEGWDVVDRNVQSSPVFGYWYGYLIGLLYERDPEAFLPSVSSLLLEGSWPSVAQILTILLHTHGRPQSPGLPAILRQALINRAHQHKSGLFSESYTLRVLAWLAPEALVFEDWEGELQEWRPSARAALADAVRVAEFRTPTALDRAIVLLLQMIQDSEYVVRRSGYRALFHHAPEQAWATLVSFSEVANHELRQRAAEGWAWLEDERFKRDTGVGDILQQLSTDRERLVRDTAKRALAERRERNWANIYLQRVRETKAGTNKEVLGAWACGKALVRTGDDSCVAVLREEMQATESSPNLKRWRKLLLKDLEERWEKTEREWPTGGAAWHGRLEEGSGIIHMDGRDFQASYVVWLDVGHTPHTGQLWGGSVRVEALADPFAQVPITFTVRLSDGRTGKAILADRSGPMIAFKGTGQYPNEGG